jgi:hypothetical protein
MTGNAKRKASRSRQSLRAALAVLLVGLLSTADAATTYLEPERFVDQAFEGSPPEADSLWLIGDCGKSVDRLLGHPYASRRLRYWHADRSTVFVLEEIGKERPITAGFVVRERRLARVAILIYRESRGGEVRHDFFTRQFRDAQLDAHMDLDRHIDGITGATLSVHAISRLARMALWLAEQIDETGSCS